VRDGRLVQQEVKQGAKGLKGVEILSGVAEGDLVVVQPSATLKSAASVRTHFAEP
jgi:hypothetical protein